MAALARGQLLALAAAAAVAGSTVLGGAAAGVVAGRAVPGSHKPSTREPSASAPVNITVARAPASKPMPAGFLGLSMEYWALAAYAGHNPRAVNPVLVQLIRNLTPGQRPVLRIGGVTTDKTWWPASDVSPPPGVNYALTPREVAVTRTLARELDARMIMGINLEADDPQLAGREARALLAGIGRANIGAFELGNEPELYGDPYFGWYVRNGQQVPGRPAGYDVTAFMNDYTRIAAALPRVPLAGPASGADEWLGHLSQFIAAEPRVSIVTVHRYPMQACYVPVGSPAYPTVAQLLSPAASRGLAESVAPYVAVAHAHQRELRVAEMNTISCGDAPDVSDSFAMALWALDALFADLQVGVDGVNIHTYPGAIYQLFRFHHRRKGWSGFVEPEYYGLLMFAQAAPVGARLLGLSDPSPAVRAWATRAPDRLIRVVLINDDVAAAQLARVKVAGAHGPATLERLQAPSATARAGVTLGGQSFGDRTDSGLLSGLSTDQTVPPTAGGYEVRLPAASAAILTLER